MFYFRLRCDLQYANSQIQRYKQGRSSSRRPRELPGSQFSLNDDNLSGGFHSDSPRPSSPTSTIDLDSGRFKLTSRVALNSLSILVPVQQHTRDHIHGQTSHTLKGWNSPSVLEQEQQYPRS